MVEEKKRLSYLDRAKGILIVLVVVGHIWQSGYLFNIIYSFHMPSFFVISGILLGVSRSYQKGFFRFFLRKLYAFGLPFLFIEFLGILTDLLRNGATLNIKGYLFNTLSFHFNDPNLWFIVDLFLAEMIFVLLLLLLRKKWAICAFVCVLFVMSFLLKTDNAYVSNLTGTCKYLPFLAFGFYGDELLKKRSLSMLILAALAVLASGIFLGPKFSGLHLGSALLEKIVSMPVALLGTYLVLQLSEFALPGGLDRVLVSAGRNSIIIYGTHHIIYATVGVLLGVTNYEATPILAGLTMLAAVAFLEFPIIYGINHWLPFLAGRHYPKRKTANT